MFFKNFQRKISWFWDNIRHNEIEFSLDEFADIVCITLKYIVNFNVVDLKILGRYLEHLIDLFKNGKRRIL